MAVAGAALNRALAFRAVSGAEVAEFSAKQQQVTVMQY
jgi:hypothetical protein